MKISYTPVVKEQPTNPFCKMTQSDHLIASSKLRERLFWLCQLGSSKDSRDQEIYDALVNHPDKKIWGSAPQHDNRPNTALAILAGAVEKLEKGDLSLKQIKTVNYLCAVLKDLCPRKWNELVFEEVTEIEVNMDLPLHKLFEIVDGSV